MPPEVGRPCRRRELLQGGAPALALTQSIYASECAFFLPFIHSSIHPSASKLLSMFTGTFWTLGMQKMMRPRDRAVTNLYSNSGRQTVNN